MLVSRLSLVSIPVFLAMLLQVGEVLANGGPVGATTMTGSGGVAPVQQGTIRLVSEDLEIRLDEDLNTYHVTASYVLANPGPETEVLFGVPVTWSKDELHFDDLRGLGEGPGPDAGEWTRRQYPRWAEQMNAGLERMRSSIQIRLGDTAVPCEMRDGLIAPVGQEEGQEVTVRQPGEQPEGEDQWLTWLDAITPSAATERETETIEHLADYTMAIAPVRSWCVAPLAVPTGDSIVLTMSYDGILWYTDLLWSKSIFTDHSTRILSYLLFPAGYWAGQVERLNIRVDLGPHDNLVLLAPPGGQRVDNRLTWSLSDVDLTTVPTLAVVLFPSRLLHAREVARWNRTNPHRTYFSMQAGASSERAVEDDRQFGPALAFDGDETTAWCEGVEGAGVGESISVTLGLPEGLAGFEENCSVQYLAMGYGDTRDATTYAAANRVRRLLVSPCDAAEPRETLSVREVASNHRLAFQPMSLDGDDRDDEEDEEVEHQGGAQDDVPPQTIGRLFRRFGLRWSAGSGSEVPPAPTEPTPELCLRFTIEEVVEGTNGHTCISEITPLVGCQ